MPRRENKSMPKVESGYLYSDEQSFALGSESWREWLVSALAFYFASPNGTFTARKELRSGGWYWYAYRRYRGRLAKLYLGKSEDLNTERLVEVARKLNDLHVEKM